MVSNTVDDIFIFYLLIFCVNFILQRNNFIIDSLYLPVIILYLIVK